MKVKLQIIVETSSSETKETVKDHMQHCINCLEERESNGAEMTLRYKISEEQ